MADRIVVLRGRSVVPAAPRARRWSRARTIPGWGGVNPVQGIITETRHELRGQSFKDKVLVFRGAKGSSGWSAMYHIARLAGTAPKALVFNEMTTKVALGAVVMRVPSVTDLDRDPLEVIETGDWVIVDGDSGIVEVRKAASEKLKPRRSAARTSALRPDRYFFPARAASLIAFRCGRSWSSS